MEKGRGATKEQNVKLSLGALRIPIKTEMAKCAPCAWPKDYSLCNEPINCLEFL